MRHIYVLILPLVLLGCGTQRGNSGSAAGEGPGTAAQSTGLTQQQNRITETPVLADRKNIDALQQRLRALNEAGVSQNNYSLAKAQCWLDTAKTQYHENDRTGYIEESMTESVRIIRALEANKSAIVGNETPLVARSTLLRPDLWQEFNALKSNAAALACYGQTVACGEIRLVRAGHAEQQTGWRQATPFVQMAEDAMRVAKRDAVLCSPAPVVAKAVAVTVPALQVAMVTPPVTPPVTAPIVKIERIERETFELRADTLFNFNKGGADQIMAGGPERIGEIAARLKNYKSIDSLVVIGHTDRFGKEDYNDALSAKRAQTVQAMLETAGVKAAKISAEGRGKREPLLALETCPLAMSRVQAIPCLQGDRRVTIEVRGIVK